MGARESLPPRFLRTPYRLRESEIEPAASPEWPDPSALNLVGKMVVASAHSLACKSRSWDYANEIAPLFNFGSVPANSDHLRNELGGFDLLKMGAKLSEALLCFRGVTANLEQLKRFLNTRTWSRSPDLDTL